MFCVFSGRSVFYCGVELLVSLLLSVILSTARCVLNDVILLCTGRVSVFGAELQSRVLRERIVAL